MSFMVKSWQHWLISGLGTLLGSSDFIFFIICGPKIIILITNFEVKSLIVNPIISYDNWKETWSTRVNNQILIGKTKF